MSNSFNIGQEYSRSDIFEILDLNPHPTGGNWFTGYVQHEGTFYVFTHIGGAGRTGHDYGNFWEDDQLRWFGKTNSRMGQPLMQKMLRPNTTVHIFWRDDNKKPFTYAGTGTPVEVRDTTPVEVLWTISFASERYEYSDPDEVPFGMYREGMVREINVNAMERNATARKACIEHYGERCEVCDLRFEKKYGDIGIGFIHVHHLQPMAITNEEYDLDPVKDLRPVCPNCHAMLHRRKQPLSIDELRTMLRF